MITNAVLRQHLMEIKEIYQRTIGVTGFKLGNQCVLIYVDNEDVAQKLPKEYKDTPIMPLVGLRTFRALGA